MSSRRPPPWEQPRPQNAGKTKLTPESIAWARDRARRAGRRYPNLVDNLAALRRQLESGDQREDEKDDGKIRIR